MMTALYRRYRPDTFEDVIGQDHVTRSLQAALTNGRINHAYLFSGPRGCGKTTCARIMARCLNCEKGPTPTPCGECDSCRDLSAGGSGSMDVVEIDAASHGKVENTRELREKAQFAPVRDRFKIYILDEAHMVTKEGFNALLKLVEEPPAHIKFIFATTDPDKVISTIRSRTHHYPFRLVAPDTLRDYLQELCDKEGVEVEDGVLGLVVRAGGGSVRDSLSILDQLIAGESEPMLHYDRAVSLLGYTDVTLLNSLVDGLIAGSGAQAYEVLNQVIQTGNEPQRFVEDLLRYFRNLVVIRLAGDADARKTLVDVPESEIARMLPQAGNMPARALTRSAEIISQTLNEMSAAVSPRLSLELLVAHLLLEVSEVESAATFEPASPAQTPPSEEASSQRGATPEESPAGRAGSQESVPAATKLPTSKTEDKPHLEVVPAPAQTPAQDSASKQDGGEETSPADYSSSEQWVFKPTKWNLVDDADPDMQDNTPGEQAPAAPAASDEPAEPAALVEPDTPAGGAGADEPSTSLSQSGGDGIYAKIRSQWAQVMEALTQRHSATAALVGTHGQLQGMRQGYVEISFEQPNLQRAFSQRHTEALAQVILDVTGQEVKVRGVAPGFGAPSSTQSLQAPDVSPAAPAPETPDNPPAAPAPETPVDSTPAPEPPKNPEPDAGASTLSAIQTAQQILGGKIVKQ